MIYKIKVVLVAGIGILCLNMFCVQKPRRAIVQTYLEVMKKPYRRSLGNKEANKVILIRT